MTDEFEIARDEWISRQFVENNCYPSVLDTANWAHEWCYGQDVQCPCCGTEGQFQNFVDHRETKLTKDNERLKHLLKINTIALEKHSSGNLEIFDKMKADNERLSKSEIRYSLRAAELSEDNERLRAVLDRIARDVYYHMDHRELAKAALEDDK